MTTNNQPVMGKKQLLKSVLSALVIGGIVLVTAVLPAEYNIDPLGTGKLFGFSRLYMESSAEAGTSEINQLNFKKLKLEEIGSGSEIPVPVQVYDPPPAEQFAEREDSITVIVPAEKGIEYKFKSLKYGSTKYEWSTNGSILYSDLHGEIIMENPPEKEFYESYTEAYSNNMTGTLTAPFEGKHGWYFRNKTKEDVAVAIRLKGQYQLFNTK